MIFFQKYVLVDVTVLTNPECKLCFLFEVLPAKFLFTIFIEMKFNWFVIICYTNVNLSLISQRDHTSQRVSGCTIPKLNM